MKVLSITFLLGLMMLLLIQSFFMFFYPKKYSNFVITYAKEYALQESLVYSVINTESSFNSNAKSKSGAIGLMQLMPNTAKWIAGELNENFETECLYNPETNIKYGCFYLRYLMDKFNNETYSLCAYNAGETVVRGWLVEENFKILYPETQNYVKKVQNNIKIYKKIYNLD